MPFVRQGNEVAVKVTLKCMLAFALGCHSVTEQPVSSLLNFAPFYKQFLSVSKSTTVLTYLGQFGSPSAKPIKVFSTLHSLRELKRPMPKGLEKLSRRKGKRVWGNLASLSASQAYPPAFGRAVVALIRREAQ